MAEGFRSRLCHRLRRNGAEARGFAVIGAISGAGINKQHGLSGAYCGCQFRGELLAGQHLHRSVLGLQLLRQPHASAIVAAQKVAEADHQGGGHGHH